MTCDKSIKVRLMGLSRIQSLCYKGYLENNDQSSKLSNRDKTWLLVVSQDLSESFKANLFYIGHNFNKI